MATRVKPETNRKPKPEAQAIAASARGKQMNIECRSKLNYAALLSLLLAVTIAISGCASPEKTKLAHVEKGEAYLKEEKFQEASLEFRNAIQIDERLASAHWGL